MTPVSLTPHPASARLARGSNDYFGAGGKTVATTAVVHSPRLFR